MIRKTKDFQKVQMKLLEIEITIYKIKYTLKTINSILDAANKRSENLKMKYSNSPK